MNLEISLMKSSLYEALNNGEVGIYITLQYMIINIEN